MIYLVRHGQTDANKASVVQGVRYGKPLNEVGINQAHEAGKKLFGLIGGRDIPIFTSPLDRTLQTAKIIRYYLSGELKEDFDLVEKDLGTWEGMTRRELEGLFQYSEYCRDKYWWKGHGGESYKDLHMRLRNWWTRVQDLYTDMVVVSHQTTIAVLATEIMSRDPLTGPKIGNCEIYTVDPGQYPARMSA